MRVEIEKLTNERILREACSFTSSAPSSMTLAKIYKCEHSPIRTQIFIIKMYDIPTFVSVHLVRHKVGVEHWVKSNREDLPSYTGDTGRNHPVNHMMMLNAQALIQIMRKRLCGKAHAKVQELMGLICEEMQGVDFDLFTRLVPDCVYRSGCYELKTCGRFYQLTFGESIPKNEVHG